MILKLKMILILRPPTTFTSAASATFEILSLGFITQVTQRNQKRMMIIKSLSENVKVHTFGIVVLSTRTLKMIKLKNDKAKEERRYVFW